MNTNNNTAHSEADIFPKHLLQAMELSNNEQTVHPKVRCFYMVDSRVIFGVNVLETNDSFLVGAPSRMVKKEVYSEVEVEQMYRGTVIRMMKSSIALVITPAPELLALYLKHLVTEGIKCLPDYMTPDRIIAAKETIESLTTHKVPPNTEAFDMSMVKEPTHPGSLLVH